MGPAPVSGIYHALGEKGFTQNWSHQSQTSRTKCLAFKIKFLEKKTEAKSK